MPNPLSKLSAFTIYIYCEYRSKEDMIYIFLSSSASYLLSFPLLYESIKVYRCLESF